MTHRLPDMKIHILLLLATAALLPAEVPRFAITSHTIAGGGNAMTSGDARFTLTGTTGQPEAAQAITSPDGRFTQAPGFWHTATIVAAPDAPPLRFLPAPYGSVLLAWPVTTSGWILEVSTDLAAGSWTPVNHAVVNTANDHTVTVPATALRQFFRLRCP